MREWVDCATLVRVQGLDGGLVCRSAAGLPLLLSEGDRCALVPPQLDAPREVTVERLRPGKRPGEAVVHFAEVGSMGVAEALAGCHCLRPADEVELPDEVIEADAMQRLAGWEVVADGEQVGVVEAVEQAPAQPRLALRRPDGRLSLIPWVDEFVVGIDDGARVLTLALPAGLLDLDA